MMARCSFGGGSSDFVMAAVNNGFIRLASATLYVWPSQAGGSQITDLLLNGAGATVIPVGADGQVPVFSGPNDGTAEVWVSAGPSGIRVRMTSGVSSATDAVMSGLVPPASGSATAAALSAAYVGRMDAASYTYNADGTVATETVGGYVTTYSYNADLSVHTAIRNGVTLTYSYNGDGSVASAV
jgi:hypothetical protein